jgi:hypothetical protein
MNYVVWVTNWVLFALMISVVWDKFGGTIKW